jgi:Ca2+/Na+ antiporter
MKGTGAFMIFVGTLLFDWNHIFELCVSLVLILIGALYIFYGFKVGEIQDKPKEEKKEKKDKEKEDRKKQYEDKKGDGNEENKKQPDNAVSSPPSYQPRGGSIKYQEDHLGKQQQQPQPPVPIPRGSANAPPDPEFAASRQPSSHPDQEAPYYQPRGGSPIRQQQEQYLPQNQPVGFANYGGYDNRFSSNNENFDEEEEDDYDNRGGYPYSANAAPQSYQAQRPAYQNQPAAYSPHPQYRQEEEYVPPPPDEEPMRIPDKLKKIKDINDLLF